MRNHGTCFELLRTRPHDHIAWVFSGPDEFAMLAAPFLAEGIARNERVMYVPDDPHAAPLRLDVLDPSVLTVASIAEVYGTAGIVDAAGQRATFAGALAEAQAEGYAGIRVAADNSSLVVEPDRLAAWVQWEVVADGFVSENAVTGLCAFDRARVDVDCLRHLATLHPLSSADAPEPQFRLFIDADVLRVEGQIDPSAIDQVHLALDNLPPKTDVVVDLTGKATISSALLLDLSRLPERGGDVTITIRAAAVASLGDVGIGDEHLHVVVV